MRKVELKFTDGEFEYLRSIANDKLGVSLAVFIKETALNACRDKLVPVKENKNEISCKKYKHVL